MMRRGSHAELQPFRGKNRGKTYHAPWIWNETTSTRHKRKHERKNCAIKLLITYRK
jgi:hypothetical protein